MRTAAPTAGIGAPRAPASGLARIRETLGCIVLCGALLTGASSCTDAVRAAAEDATRAERSTAEPTPLRDPDARLAWPFRPGAGERVYQTYGQAEGADDENIMIHLGLDIAAPAGTPVFSPLSGEVVMVFSQGCNVYTQGIAIRSIDGDTQRVVKLLHLEPSSTQFALGDQVRRGDFVGELVEWPTETHYHPHLHVEIGEGRLIAQPDGPDLAPGIEFRANRNPLLVMEHQEDRLPPRGLHDGAGNLLTFHAMTRGADAPDWTRAPKDLDPTGLTGLVDIELPVQDRISLVDTYRVAPLAVRLEVHGIDHPDVAIARELRFDGVLDTTNDPTLGYYVRASAGPGPEARFVYHFMGLCEGPDAGGNHPAQTPWNTADVPPGRYRVTAFAEDCESEVKLAETEVTVRRALTR